MTRTIRLTVQKLFLHPLQRVHFLNIHLVNVLLHLFRFRLNQFLLRFNIWKNVNGLHLLNELILHSQHFSLHSLKHYIQSLCFLYGLLRVKKFAYLVRSIELLWRLWFVMIIGVFLMGNILLFFVMSWFFYFSLLLFILSFMLMLLTLHVAFILVFILLINMSWRDIFVLILVIWKCLIDELRRKGEIIGVLNVP